MPLAVEYHTEPGDEVRHLERWPLIISQVLYQEASNINLALSK